MDRAAVTLSAGEAQRLRLAALLGSGLTGVLYVLDEPTVGLHARDTKRLIEVLKKLRDLGNMVLVIEHDIEIMQATDYIVDFGPEAGKCGGEIVAAGTPDEIAACESSFTGRCHFSFNVPGGRCEKCEGSGEITITMHFLPDVQVKCPVCHGRRFRKSILEVQYKGFSISDILQMTIAEAAALFCDVPPIMNRLTVLQKVGLGYLSLGQSATTLSGGEAQRIKLAKELGKRTSGHTLYLLDEPTTGLHPHDVKKLVALLNELVELGNTVICVEHNLDVIAMSDWVIDFGPEGGDAGGEIIVQGTPETIAKTARSQTSACLGFILESQNFTKGCFP
jgi:excinuclease UvrABC ATPase subunit